MMELDGMKNGVKPSEVIYYFLCANVYIVSKK